jgi:hypothetical protein
LGEIGTDPAAGLEIDMGRDGVEFPAGKREFASARLPGLVEIIDPKRAAKSVVIPSCYL